jgi:hypothetical protein
MVPLIAWLVLNGGAVFVAGVLAVAAGFAARPSHLVLATSSGYLVLVHSLVLGAGLLGHLTPAGLGLLLAVAVAAALWLARRAPPDHGGPDGGGPLTLTARLVSLAAVGVFGVWAWPHLVQATRLWIWDDYTYHMVYPALWLGQHAIAAPSPPQAFTMQAWYPLSASVVAAWFMTPLQGSRGDALAWVSLTGPLYGGIVAGGAATLLARVGCRPGAWVVPIALFATSPRIGVMASSFSDADLAMAAALFGSLVFAVPRATDEDARDVWADASYAGLLSGLALGVKVSAAPLALVVLSMVARRGWTRAGWRGAARVTLVVATAWTATCGYWYARNVVHTGNPVYPAKFLLWPGTTFPETTLLEYARRYGAWRTIADAAVVYADWPRSHTLLAVLGLLGLAVWTAWPRRSPTRAGRYFAGGALAMAAAMQVLLPFAPYSAGNALTFRSGFIHWDSMRYVALIPILGWVALGFLVDTVSRRVRVPVAAAPGTRMTTRGRLLVLGALALGGAAGVIGWHGAKAAATAAFIHREPLFGAVVAVLDRQPPGARVAVFGDQWIYPAFGDRNHLQPVRVDGDGRIATSPIGGAMEPGDLTVDPATLRANLAAAGISVVVAVRLPHPGRSPELPAQHAALETISDANLLHRDAAAAVWRLGP